MKIEELLKSKNHNVKLSRVELETLNDIDKFDLIILASPTYGHGQLEPHFIKFYETHLNKNFKNKKFAVIGLGDFKYDIDYHIESAKILEDFVKKVNGKLIIEALRISRSPIPHLNTYIQKWGEELANILNRL
jgi:flavodoxin I